MMLSQSLYEIELRMGLGKGSKTVLGCTHVVKQLSFSMFPSILTFDFDLILWSFFIFWALMGYFLGIWVQLENFLGVYLCSSTFSIFYVSVSSAI